MAEVLRDRGHDVMLLISEKDIDALAVSGHTDFRVEKLPTVGLPRRFLPRSLVSFAAFTKAYHFAALYRKFKPQVILGMGGFTSTAPVLAGRIRGIATFIHESNAVPGKANRIDGTDGARGDARLQGMRAFLSKTRTEVTGTPVRTELVRLDRRVAREKLGLDEDLPTLLVMGGSQGASGINQALIKSLPFLQGVPLQVIHLRGARDERLVSDNYRRENIPAYIAAFHHRMEEVYSAADLVVARAGAASLAEFAAFSLPGILIPFPYATDDHQTRNAEIYARIQAAILIKESDVSGELLARNIRELIQDRQRIEQMAANSSHLASKDAAGRVATTMEKYTTHEARV